MSEKIYTVCLLCYNQTDRIKKACDVWNSLEIPPKQIIIMDDGSDDGCIVENLQSNILIYRFKHCANTAYMRNYTVDNLVKTEKFFIGEISSIPYKDAINIMLEGCTPRRIITPVVVDVDHIHFPNIRCPSVNIKLNSIWSCDLTIYHKSTFPYVNESYDKWGGEDNDLLYRFLLGGGEIIFSTATKFIHLKHSKPGEFYEDSNNTDKLLRMIKYYNDNKLVVIPKNSDGRRII